MKAITIHRIYEDGGDEQGRRILVDRLWPRGITKERAALDLWLKDVAPSTELRKWFHAEERDWDEFRRRYVEELRASPGLFRELLAEAEKGPIVLLYAVRDEQQNHAAILRELLLAHMEDDAQGCGDCLW